MKTKAEILEVLSHIRYHHMNQDWTFYLGSINTNDWPNETLYLQIRYKESDVDTGEMKEQHGRKWLISQHMTTSEIVQTAFKAVMTSMEHIAREHFEYKGQRVLGPHFDVERMVELARVRAVDVRKPRGE